MTGTKTAPKRKTANGTTAFSVLLCGALRRLRESRGISRKELATKLGVTTIRLKQFECGKAWSEPLYHKVVQALHRDVGIPEVTDAKA